MASLPIGGDFTAFGLSLLKSFFITACVVEQTKKKCTQRERSSVENRKMRVDGNLHPIWGGASAGGPKAVSSHVAMLINVRGPSAVLDGTGRD